MPVVRYRAAGGVVVDGDRVLVLRRPSRNQVRLPKGHVEHGEREVDAAVREVREESGVEPRVVADLGSQVVEFTNRDRVERTERFFLMESMGSSGAPEAQFVPEWLTWDEALARLTFEAEREWVRRARAARAREGSGP